MLGLTIGVRPDDTRGGAIERPYTGELANAATFLG
jgi:hypothetical protein